MQGNRRTAAGLRGPTISEEAFLLLKVGHWDLINVIKKFNYIFILDKILKFEFYFLNFFKFFAGHSFLSPFDSNFGQTYFGSCLTKLSKVLFFF